MYEGISIYTYLCIYICINSQHAQNCHYQSKAWTLKTSKLGFTKTEQCRKSLEEAADFGTVHPCSKLLDTFLVSSKIYRMVLEWMDA